MRKKGLHMKLSEIQGEAAFDVLADIIEPATTIISDPTFKELLTSGKQLDTVKYLLRNQKKPIMEIMAIVDGEDPKTYKPNLLTIPIKLVELLNDDAVMELFTSAAPNTPPDGSGSATETIQAEGQ